LKDSTVSIKQNEKSRRDHTHRIASAQQRQLVARYARRLQQELSKAKLAGKTNIEARALLRVLRLHGKRPSIGKAILAAVLGELRNPELLPQVLQ
jgi:hypothetical protein